MKKMLIFLMVIVLLTLSVLSCSSSEQQGAYTIKLCDFSDSILQAGLYQEYQLLKGLFVDESVEQTLKINFAGFDFEGTYWNSGQYGYDNYIHHTYMDENKGFISITDDGKVVALHYGPPITRQLSEFEETDIIYTEAECHDVAYDFFENVLHLNAENYIASTEYMEKYRAYRFEFKKQVGEFSVSEYICVDVAEKNGLLYNYIGHLVDKIPIDAQVNFDVEEIDRQITTRLDELYADYKDNFDKVEYTFENHQLTLDDDGNYILVISVSIDLITIYEDGIYSNIGEALLFVAWEN